jgi:hypothetical protein
MLLGAINHGGRDRWDMQQVLGGEKVDTKFYSVISPLGRLMSVREDNIEMHLKKQAMVWNMEWNEGSG